MASGKAAQRAKVWREVIRRQQLWGSPKLTHLCSDKRTLSLTACRVAAVMVADAAVPRC
jgi:hypothetical protein